MGNTNVTVLVNSCDLYEDAWYPFFKLFNIQWSNCAYRFLLNTENKSFSCEGMNVEVFNGGNDIPWSQRMLKALEQVDTEYVLFFLEDFFLMSPVNETVFNEAVNCLDQNPDIGAICFDPDSRKELWQTEGTYNSYFTEITRSSHARVNAVAALWRKSFLIKVARKKESPWDFELLGTKRAKHYKEKILCLDPKSPKVFDFHIYKSFGYGITQKKWLPKNKELFEKYGITVNFENLGWFEYTNEKRKKRSKKELLGLIFKNPKEFVEIIITKLKHM